MKYIKKTSIYRRIGIILGAFLLMISVVVILSLNQKPSSVPQLKPPIAHNPPTAIPSPTIDPNKPGFHGYDDYEPWFDLALPSECSISIKEMPFATKIITCIVQNFTIIIYPQSGGRELKTIKADTVTLNGYTWHRVIYDEDSQTATTYSLTVAAKHPTNHVQKNIYLLDVKYAPYTPEAQTYFETILASFHFINQ